ncbi:PAN2-PAN3 deadenylation complex subunit PAN3 [Mycena kentingensis (nom. inval.)]|nr:PAN2-PAN3 deadenylation complex subunit PAN3 [Mycena kentingensis (nom. inval.)]
MVSRLLWFVGGTLTAMGVYSWSKKEPTTHHVQWVHTTQHIHTSTHIHPLTPQEREKMKREARKIIYDIGNMTANGTPPLRATSPPITATPVISSPALSLAANAHAPVFVPKLSMRVQSPAAPAPPDDVSVATTRPVDVSRTSVNGYYSDPRYPELSASPVFMRQPLNYHLYSTPIPATFLGNARDTHFVPPSSHLRTELQIRGEDLNMAAPPGFWMPEEMQGYHSIVPLDNLTADRHKFQNNWNSTVYRAINSKDGLTYCLRRVQNFRMTNQSAFGSVETWSKLRHPNIVALHEAFTTHAFGDSSLVVAYTYHPRARTLHETYLKTTAAQRTGSPYNIQSTSSSAVAVLPERLLWSYIIQIATAIKSVHDAGHAAKCMRCTVSTTRRDIHTLQQEDLTHFGRLVLALISGQMMGWSGNNFQRTIDLMGRVYSPDVKTVALYLFNKGHHKVSSGLFGIATHDFVRLLCKLGFINERPEFARDDRWSETGDRYIIKLFRDYVFHQLDETGNPNVNIGHVLACLNKLDAGTEEKLLLTSRNEQSCLVVNYKQVKACIQSAFEELARPEAGAGSGHGSTNKFITTAGLDTHGVLNRHATKNTAYQIGVSEAQGNRRTMEDTHSFVLDFANVRGQGFFAVFDGHAGKHAAEWCGSHFHSYLLSSMNRHQALPIPEILNQTFHDVDENLCRMCEESQGKIHSGCTAVTAFLRVEDDDGQQSFLAASTGLDDLVRLSSTDSTSSPSGVESANKNKKLPRSLTSGRIRKAFKSLTSPSHSPKMSPSPTPEPPRSRSPTSAAVFVPPTTARRVLYCANAGDARGVLCRGGMAVRLTYDHKASDEQEAKRIRDAGGCVTSGRVNGVLAVTRSLGDYSVKDFVIGAPYTTETELCDDDEFLILACDGLWDVMTDQTAVDLIHAIPDAQDASHVLLKGALNAHTSDNVTILVIRFRST